MNIFPLSIQFPLAQDCFNIERTVNCLCSRLFIQSNSVKSKFPMIYSTKLGSINYFDYLVNQIWLNQRFRLYCIFNEIWLNQRFRLKQILLNQPFHVNKTSRRWTFNGLSQAKSACVLLGLVKFMWYKCNFCQSCENWGWEIRLVSFLVCVCRARQWFVNRHTMTETYLTCLFLNKRFGIWNNSCYFLPRHL